MCSPPVVRQGPVRGYFGDAIDIILGLGDTPPLLEIAGGQTLDGDDYGA